MQTDTIEAIGIDEHGSLWVKPAAVTFPFIYRAGMEVQWDDQNSRLYSPVPREWTYVDWYVQIKNAVRQEYGVALKIEPTTLWTGITPELQAAIIAKG